MASAILPPTMKRVVIGAARVDEAEQILELQRLSYRTEAALYDDWTLPPLTQTLRELLEQYDDHTIARRERHCLRRSSDTQETLKNL
jgi:hypothetical protein